MSWRFIAKIKILKDRAAGWAVLANLFMISHIFAKDNPNGIIILIIGAAVIIALSIIDYLYILPKEQELYWQKNPEWRRR